MAENTTSKSSVQGEKVRTKILDFELTKGGVVEYTLEDGTLVRLQPRLEQALQEIDEDGKPISNQQGMPVYHFNFGIQTQIIPKNRTIYIPKPPDPTSTQQSRMVV